MFHVSSLFLFFHFHLLPTGLIVSVQCSPVAAEVCSRLSFGFVIHRSSFAVRICRSPFTFVVRHSHSSIIVLSSSSPFSFPSSFAFAPLLELISYVHVRVSHIHCCHVRVSHLHCCHVQAILLFSYYLLGLLLLLCLIFPFFLFFLG